MFRTRQFGDEQLEQAYRAGRWRQCVDQLISVLYVLVVALLIIAYNHIYRPDGALIWAVGSAAAALVGTFWLWISAATLCVLVPISALVFLPMLISVFVFYTVLPVGLTGAVVGSTSLSLIHLTSFILSATSNNNTDAFAELKQTNARVIVEQLVAQLLAHAWANFVGVYLFTARNRLCRAAFLNARNALASQRDAVQQFTRMGALLRATLPVHIISDVQQQLGVDVPRVYVEHYTQTSVIFARLNGLQAVLDQLSVQDSARLLSEFHYRLDQLVSRYNFVRLRSDAIVVVSGILPTEENDETQRPFQSYFFARDVMTIFRSFCDATTANLQLRVGIGSGALSCGIVGAQKWHYDAVGEAFNFAEQLESTAPANAIIVDDTTNDSLVRRFHTERNTNGDGWHVVSYRTSPGKNDNIDGEMAYCLRSGALPSLLFSSAQKRFSLITVPQAVSCLLQSSAVASAASSAAKLTVAAVMTPITPPILLNNCSNGSAASELSAPLLYNVGRRRKRKSTDLEKSSPRSLSDTKALLGNGSDMVVDRRGATIDGTPLFHAATQRFYDVDLERQYVSQIDRWLIPALAISILFLVLNAVYQMLVLPRLFSTLLISVGSLLILLAVLLLLYIKYCEFVTRTSVGYSITVLLVLVVLFLSGIVNMFSCDRPAVDAVGEATCREIHYAAGFVALWTLTAALFIRFGFFRLMCVIGAALATYGIHLFSTHYMLYQRYSLRLDYHIEHDITVALITLALIVLLEARRNERMLRVDFLSVLKTIEETRRLKHYELLNEQLIFSALPAHIAHHYLTREDPYQHMCQSVGVLCARIGTLTDWRDENGFDRLNRIVFALDQTLAQFAGVEKIRSAHCVYSFAVGVQPENAVGGVAANVNDAPRTIGDLLATLAELALRLQQIIDEENLKVAIGMDCGPALSLVVGRDRPQYELVGVPCERARRLMQFADTPSAPARIIVSEEIHLALRPRITSDNVSFDFCGGDKPISVASDLAGYALVAKPRRDSVNLRASNKSAVNCQPFSTPKSAHYSLIGVSLRGNDSAQRLSYQPSLITAYGNSKITPVELQNYNYIIQHQDISEHNSEGVPLTTLRMSDAHIVHQQTPPIAASSLTAAVKEMKRVSSGMPTDINMVNRTNPPTATLTGDSGATESLSASESSFSGIDYDEIDECVAAAACERKKNQSIDSVDNSALPSDLRALAKDKRMSGYLNESPLSRVGDCRHSRRDISRHLAERNPFEMFSSLNSSFSSELYSVDISVESDSDIEWITPEMIRYNDKNNKNFSKLDYVNNNNVSARYGKPLSRSMIAQVSAHSSRRALNKDSQKNERPPTGGFVLHRRQYSDQCSDRRRKDDGNARWEALSSQMQRKRFRVSRNGPKLPAWLTSSSRTSLSSQFTSPHSQPTIYSALDRLDFAARRVDKMLQELASVDDNYSQVGGAPDCAPFPLHTASLTSTDAFVNCDSASTQRFCALRRETSSAGHTDYDNAECSEDACSDSELVLIYNENRRRRDNVTAAAAAATAVTRPVSEFGASCSANRLSLPNNNNNTNKKSNNTLAQKLKRAFLGFSDESLDDDRAALPPFPPDTYNRPVTRNRHMPAKRRVNASTAGAYEADVDSNCSSLASSLVFLNAAGRPSAGAKSANFFSVRPRSISVHSVGYENEYELVSESEYGVDSELNVNELPRVDGVFDPTRSTANVGGAPANFIAIDADEAAPDEAVRALSRDIRLIFGDYELTGFAER